MSTAEAKRGLGLGEPFLRQGNYPVYVQSVSVSTSFAEDPTKTRRKIETFNTPNNILYRFFTVNPGATDGSMTYRVSTLLNGGGRVSLMKPTSPYGFDLLVNAIPSGFEERGTPRYDNGEVRPDTFFMLDQGTRRAFNAAGIGMLRALHEGRDVKKGEKAFYMQNWAAGLNPDAAQSLYHVHGRVTRIDPNQIRPFEGEITTREVLQLLDVPHDEILRIEREEKITSDAEVMKRVGDRIRSGVNAYIKKSGRKVQDFDISLGVRTAKPYGISVAFDGNDPITIDNTTHPANLERILLLREALNWSYQQVARAYERFAYRTDILRRRYGAEYGTDLSLTPQPSSQEIIDVDENGLVRFTLAPVMSRFGPIEKTGAIMLRENDPALYKEYREKDFKSVAHAGGKALKALGEQMTHEVL